MGFRTPCGLFCSLHMRHGRRAFLFRPFPMQAPVFMSVIFPCFFPSHRRTFSDPPEFISFFFHNPSPTPTLGVELFVDCAQRTFPCSGYCSACGPLTYGIQDPTAHLFRLESPSQIFPFFLFDPVPGLTCRFTLFSAESIEAPCFFNGTNPLTCPGPFCPSMGPSASPTPLPSLPGHSSSPARRGGWTGPRRGYSLPIMLDVNLIEDTYGPSGH